MKLAMYSEDETELSDQEIASAVAYVVSRARIVLGEQITALPATGAGMDEPADSQSIDDAVVQMFLLLIGKDRWK